MQEKERMLVFKSSKSFEDYEDLHQFSTEEYTRPLDTKDSRAYKLFKLASQTFRVSKYLPFWQHYWISSMWILYQTLFVLWYEMATQI